VAAERQTSEKHWNISVGLSPATRRIISYAAAQHGMSVRAWGADVVEAGARLALFGDYLRGIAEDGAAITKNEAIVLVRKVEHFKIKADPHPRRVELADKQIEAIAESVCDPLNALVAREVGRQQSYPLESREARCSERERSELSEDGPIEEVTLCLTKSVHNLVLSAATVCRRTKRQLVLELMEAAGAMGRAAGLKRQAHFCGEDRVSNQDIVDTWIGMLLATGCISNESELAPIARGGAGRSRNVIRFRNALLSWYAQYSQRGVEVLEADLRDAVDDP
jgi:hypothetical protein